MTFLYLPNLTFPGHPQKYGGRVVASAATARVIIADDTQPAFETLVNRHEHSPIHVEPPEWVASCITRKKYDHDVAMPKAVGGRKVGAAYVGTK